MDLDVRQANDVAAFYRATGELPPGISLSDPSVMEAMNRLGAPGRPTNLHPVGGLDQNITNDFLSGFGQSSNRIDPVNDVIVPAATAVAFEVAPIATIGGLAGSAVGAAAGHDLGGAQGAQIGGITGGVVGGAAGGLAAGGAAGAADSVAAGTSQETFATGSSAFNPGTSAIGAGAGVGDSAFGGPQTSSSSVPSAAIGGIGAADSAFGGPQTSPSGTSTGFTPATGISGTGSSPASSGGSGPGASLGTDPSTSQSISGGATGSASTPGAPALGTGAQAPIGGPQPLSQIAQGAQDISSAARLAASVDSLVNQPSAQPQSQAPQQTAGTTPSVEPPIGNAQPVSQIAAAQPAAAVPMGQFQSATDDFTRNQENTIRAQFANSGITGSPMEQRAIQQADLAANQRSSAIQQAMTSAGIADQSVFTALMSSGLQTPEQFQNVITQLRARGVI